jgi:hypothetical protein
MTDSTLLVLSGMGVTPYSARGLSQSLEPINAAASSRRTINGTLRNLAQTQFEKYKSTITCTDQDVPALEGVFPGMTLTVDCVAELAYADRSAGPTRTPVPGSEREADGFTFYRPRLSMMVINYSETVDEWGAVTQWKLDLEEV